MAGCIVTIGRDGALQVIQGLVRPEDMPKRTESGDAGTSAGNGRDPDAVTHGVPFAGPSVSTPMAPPKDREAEARKEAGVGIGLADDLRSIRTALIKAKLAGDFESAFDLALFQMGRAVFTPGPSRPCPRHRGQGDPGPAHDPDERRALRGLVAGRGDAGRSLASVLRLAGDRGSG